MGSSSVFRVEGEYKDLSDLYEHLSRIGLDEEVIHLWCILEGDLSGELRSILSGDEIRKYNSFRFKEDRQHYLFSRGVLRVILGMYLGYQPQHLDFVYDQKGKPFLDERFGKISFNLSHSNAMNLYAIAASGNIGVDVEYLRPLKYVDEMAERLFNDDDLKFFRQLSNEKKNIVYMKSWTMKEAFFKATGYDLPKYEYQLEENMEKNEARMNKGYWIISFNAGEMYITSLAYRNP
jgi:4'-phosphopantetheinyl transferase